MASKEQTTISKKARSNQEAPKPAIANSNIIAQHQIHPATLIQQARINPSSLTTRDVTQLQRMIGNQAVGSLLAQPPPSHTQVVQRRLGGELAATKMGGQLKDGLTKFNLVGIKFSEWQGYLDRLIAADTDINSFAEAVIYLFGDVSTQKEAVAKAKQAIKEKQEKAAENAEKARKKASMAAQYPSDVLGTYYRGDGRPQMKVWSDGLTPYVILSVAEARAKIQLWFGNTGVGPTALHQSWVSNNNDPTPGTTATGPQGGILACGNNIGCGGYGADFDGAVRNVYKIDLAQANLQVVQPTLAVLGVLPHSQQGPALILNAPTLATATIIGVKGTGSSAHETSFFCGIPATNVTLIYEQTGPDSGKGRGWITPL